MCRIVRLPGKERDAVKKRILPLFTKFTAPPLLSPVADRQKEGFFIYHPSFWLGWRAESFYYGRLSPFFLLVGKENLYDKRKRDMELFVERSQNLCLISGKAH